MDKRESDYTKDERQKLLEERHESESRAARRITNDDLVCKDCMHRLSESDEPKITVSQCRKYLVKPKEVFNGECEYYQPGEESTTKRPNRAKGN